MRSSSIPHLVTLAFTGRGSQPELPHNQTEVPNEGTNCDERAVLLARGALRRAAEHSFDYELGQNGNRFGVLRGGEPWVIPVRLPRDCRSIEIVDSKTGMTAIIRRLAGHPMEPAIPQWNSLCR